MKIKEAFITDNEDVLELEEAQRTFRGYLVNELVERDLELMNMGEVYQKASECLFNEYMKLNDTKLKLKFNDAFRGEYDDEM